MKNAPLSSTGKRPYHSRVRQRQAEETHQRILDAARELLLSKGYASTTLEMIAELAEVSPKTISAVFGSKRGILAELINPAAFGKHFQQLRGDMLATSDPQQRLALVAKMTRQAYESFIPAFELLRTASAVAPELTELSRQIEMRRRTNQADVIAFLDKLGMLRCNLSLDEAVDILWSLTSYDLYHLLVIERGWPPERYESWLVQLLIEQLIEPANE
jgi:AcrR family transcriptional regulator